MARKKVDAATKAFIKALDALEEERGIAKATVLDALKEALEKSYKKNYLGPDSIVNVEIDEETGKIRLFEIKHVVDDIIFLIYIFIIKCFFFSFSDFLT